MITMNSNRFINVPAKLLGLLFWGTFLASFIVPGTHSIYGPYNSLLTTLMLVGSVGWIVSRLLFGPDEQDNPAPAETPECPEFVSPNQESDLVEEHIRLAQHQYYSDKELNQLKKDLENAKELLADVDRDDAPEFISALARVNYLAEAIQRRSTNQKITS